MREKYPGSRSAYAELGKVEYIKDGKGSWRCTWETGKPVAYGRWTKHSFWLRARKFREFRDIVRSSTAFFIRPPRLGVLANIRVVVYTWNPRADPDNNLKAIMDALTGIAVRDDCWSYFRSLSIERSREKEDGWMIECIYDPVDPRLAESQRKSALASIKRKAHGTAKLVAGSDDDELIERLEEGFRISREIESPIPRTPRPRRRKKDAGLPGEEGEAR